MKNYFKKNKKMVVGVFILLIIILIILILKLFVFPSFNGNKYGDRLKESSKHVISNDVISKIKNMAKDNDSVSKIDYHKEGRVLNFIITVDSNFGTNQAKDFAGSLLGKIDDDDKKYYDIQLFINSDEKSDNYPIIGYKSKNSDNINFGNAGGSGE